MPEDNSVEVEGGLTPTGRTAAQPAGVRGLASLVEQLARQVNTLCWTEDMQAAQWSALRYFAMAGPRARTVVGLARYQGTNPGTASRTVAVLSRRGLLSAAVLSQDRRVRLLSLTPAGHELLKLDPLRQVEAAIAGMPADRQTALAGGVLDLLERLIGGQAGHGRAAELASPDE